jgi:hypothetical protein
MSGWLTVAIGGPSIVFEPGPQRRQPTRGLNRTQQGADGAPRRGTLPSHKVAAQHPHEADSQSSCAARPKVALLASAACSLCLHHEGGRVLEDDCGRMVVVAAFGNWWSSTGALSDDARSAGARYLGPRRCPGGARFARRLRRLWTTPADRDGARLRRARTLVLADRWDTSGTAARPRAGSQRLGRRRPRWIDS